MKPRIIYPILIVALSGVSSINAQTPEIFPDGVVFGNPERSRINSWDAGDGRSGSQLYSMNGGLIFYSDPEETTPGAYDGGISLWGNPINIIPASGPYYDSGKFDVWKGSEYGGPAAVPVFRIDTGANTAAFDSLAVSISNGSLMVGGSPVITNASAGTALTGQGFLNGSTLASALNSTTPPTSSAWTSAFVPRGTVSNGAYFAVGDSASASGISSTAVGYSVNASGWYSVASGNSSIASGPFSTATGLRTTSSGYFSVASGNGSIASGGYSVASGYSSIASGLYSTAIGNRATSSGSWSSAQGNNASAKSSTETVFGRYNIESNPTSGLSWSGLDGLFRVGNGSSGNLSDALTVLKSGQTTLINKIWKSRDTLTVPATADPSETDTTDSGGNALVVDGHTVLNGKVTISVAQGDISMGIYGN